MGQLAKIMGTRDGHSLKTESCPLCFSTSVSAVCWGEGSYYARHELSTD